jgi:hypothetical protein
VVESFNGGVMAQIDVGDRYNFALGANVTRNHNGIAKKIARVILSGGIFDTSRLNVENYKVVPINNDVIQLHHILNNMLDPNSAGTFTVTETNVGTSGLWDAGDTYKITLSALAKRNGLFVNKATIQNTSAFVAGKLNAPDAGIKIYSGVTSMTATSWNLTSPGDQITVRLDSTVTDPAGNTIDTNQNTQSGTVN